MSEFESPSVQLKNLLEKDNFQDIEKYINQADLSLEPFLIDSLPEILYKLTNNKTSEEAKKIGELIIQKMNPFSMKLYMEVLYENMKSMKWQVKKGSLMLLGLFAKHQQEIVKFNLPNMILRLIDMASDVKKDVQEQTRVCFNELCAAIDNVDIIKIIPDVINGYMEPVKFTEKAMDELVATSFINEVDMSTLGLLITILTRGMREKKVAVKRRSALVIGNMCKLVNDPRTASYFYPILKPVLERGIDEIAVEEVRKVCQNSLNTLQRVSSEAAEISENVMKYNELLEFIRETSKEEQIDERLLSHMARCCEGLTLSNDRKRENWVQCLEPCQK